MSIHKIKWVFSSFDNLSSEGIYESLRLRQDIFIVEQNSIYPDIDGLDYDSHHLLGYAGSHLQAYLRIVPPGQKFSEPSIGRIVVEKGRRNTGIGTELVKQGIIHTKQLYNRIPIRIEAQAHLEQFYGAIGFSKVTDAYDKDGIPHIQMLLN